MTMLSINTNVGALKAAQASYSVNKSMETSMARLSSGKRINSAADDAAGIQIANRLTAEIQGLNQSVRNAADAQAMLATAEGASHEVHTILLRMRELAVQAANGTADGGGDRAALKSEFDALESEINRIAAKTTFAGIQLVDGSFTALDSGKFQVGAYGSETITHTIESLNTVSIGLPAAIDLTTYTKANSAIVTLDKAISNVGTEREQLGAVMNRLDHAIANLQQVSTNLSSAKGRIMDADFATESTALSKSQILNQAATSMLAQANQSKSLLLQLIQ